MLFVLAEMAGFEVRCILIDGGSSADVMFAGTYAKMGLPTLALSQAPTLLRGVSSLILLVAMIGAIVLTMHRTTKVQRQDVFRRNALDSRRTIMRRTTDQITIY